MNIIKWVKEKFNITDEYPDTVAEVLDDNIKYKNGTDKAVIKFKKTHPWKGNLREIQSKILTLNSDLSEVYQIEPPQVIFVKRFVFGPCYFPIGNLIILQEKNGIYPILTYLHEFGHALGKNEKQTCKWSINLFRKHFFEVYSKLEPHGHLLLLPKRNKK